LGIAGIKGKIWGCLAGFARQTPLFSSSSRLLPESHYYKFIKEQRIGEQEGGGKLARSVKREADEEEMTKNLRVQQEHGGGMSNSYHAGRGS
jgi:hypothetical protein